MAELVNFCGPSYVSQSQIADAERTINLIPTPVEGKGAPADWIMVGTPGFTTKQALEVRDAFDNVVTEQGLGLFQTLGRLFAIKGTTLYEVFPTTWDKQEILGVDISFRQPGILPNPSTPSYSIGVQAGAYGTTASAITIASGDQGSIGFVITPDTIGGTGQGVIWTDPATGYGLYLIDGGANTSYVALIDSTGVHQNTSVINRDTYHFLVLTTNAGSAKWYLDGSADGTFTWTDSIAFSEWFSHTATANHLVASFLSDVAYYPTELSGGQVTVQYNLIALGGGDVAAYRAQIISDGADNYWELQDGIGLTLADSVGSLPITLTKVSLVLSVNDNLATWATSGHASNQVVFTTGNTGYCIDLTANLVTIALQGADFVCYQDDFFLALDGKTSTLKLSNLGDGSTWDPTQVETRVTSGDPWVAMIQAPWNEIVLFGSQSTDFFYNAGVYPFPFQQNPGVSLQYGILAPFSAFALGNSIYFLGQNESGTGIVFELSGHNAVPVTNFGISNLIQSYGLIDNAYTWGYSERGHAFACMTFPGATDSRGGLGRTLCFDLVTRQWHERQVDRDGLVYASKPVAQTFMANQYIIQNRDDGAICVMSSDVFTESDGSTIFRIRQTPSQVSELKRVIYPGFQVFMEVGVGSDATVSTPITPLSDVVFEDAIGSSDMTLTNASVVQTSVGPLGNSQTGLVIGPASGSFTASSGALTSKTWECWIVAQSPMPVSSDTYGAILVDDGGVGNGLYLKDDGGSVSVVLWYGGALRAQTSPLTLGAVYHVVFVWNVGAGLHASLDMYLNGVLDDISASLDKTTVFAMNRMFSNTANEYLATQNISNIAIYEQALTAPQVAAHYALKTATGGEYAAAVVADGASHFWSLSESLVTVTDEFTSNPQCCLEWSNDSGRTWSNKHFMPMGRAGEWSRRVIWRNTGQARGRVWRFSADPRVPVRLLAAYEVPEPLVGLS